MTQETKLLIEKEAERRYPVVNMDAYIQLHPQDIQKEKINCFIAGAEWMAAQGWVSVEKDGLPKEGGRYWCYVKELNDLGFSYFQWNCCYHADTKTFTDSTFKGGETVTHWTYLLPNPA